MNKPSFFERLTGSVPADDTPYTAELISSRANEQKSGLNIRFFVCSKAENLVSFSYE